MKKKKKYSVKQYADKIGKSRQWVHILILKGEVKAEKVGRSFIIELMVVFLLTLLSFTCKAQVVVGDNVMGKDTNVFYCPSCGLIKYIQDSVIVGYFHSVTFYTESNINLREFDSSYNELTGEYFTLISDVNLQEGSKIPIRTDADYYELFKKYQELLNEDKLIRKYR